MADDGGELEIRNWEIGNGGDGNGGGKQTGFLTPPIFSTATLQTKLFLQSSGKSPCQVGFCR